jgi:hypothetical protein
MTIPRYASIGDRTQLPHTGQVQQYTEDPPYPSTAGQSSSNTPTTAERASVLDQIRRRLHVVDREIEPSEIFQRLERRDADR